MRGADESSWSWLRDFLVNWWLKTPLSSYLVLESSVKGSPWLANSLSTPDASLFISSILPLPSWIIGGDPLHVELRSSAGADFAVFGRSTVLIDSSFLAPRLRRSAECSWCFECRIAGFTCMTKLACGMLPHVTILKLKSFFIRTIFYPFWEMIFVDMAWFAIKKNKKFRPSITSIIFDIYFWALACTFALIKACYTRILKFFRRFFKKIFKNEKMTFFNLGGHLQIDY